MTDVETTPQNADVTDDDVPREKPNVFFKLVIPASMLFVMTLFSLVAARMGRQDAPVNGFLDRYAGLLLTGEVIVILLLALIAMATDRRRLIEKRQASDRGADAATLANETPVASAGDGR